MKKGINIFITCLIIILISVYLLVWIAPKFLSKTVYVSAEQAVSSSTIEVKDVITHIATPSAVKAIYISSWVAGTPSISERLYKMIDDTELNAVVIDIKDYTGRISFLTDNKKLESFGSPQSRIRDIKALIKNLHERNIYVIGRISSFQDAYLVNARPELAVKKRTDGKIWKDRKGISWLDPGSEEVWKYLIEIGNDSYNVGFDELNFDYIRFPSDGNMLDIAYPFSMHNDKAEIIKKFFAYLRENLGDTGAILSADLFGMTTTNKDDLGIGQILENALVYMDYVAPMVYPSHFPTGFYGMKNPSAEPYRVVQISMKRAVERAEMASTSPNKLRPWLQDFSIGKTDYTPEMVRAQIQATYDVGLSSWMLWDAGNKYSPSALIHSTE
ncbi:MAG: putative glycoside hydrolase [bacterium]|nr:putative glycoside hydrolase [bacterium]